MAKTLNATRASRASWLFTLVRVSLFAAAGTSRVVKRSSSSPLTAARPLPSAASVIAPVMPMLPMSTNPAPKVPRTAPKVLNAYSMAIAWLSALWSE
jgi:hypothetical protein